MQQTFWSKARFFVLLLLVSLITISSHPVVVQISLSAGIREGTILSRYIFIVFGLLFLLCLNFKHVINNEYNRNLWTNLIIIAISFILSFALFGEENMVSDIRSITICLIAIMIGYELILDVKRLKILLLVFASLSLFVGIMQIMMNIGGFVILEQYKIESKNSIGVMISSASVIFMYLSVNDVKINRVILFGLSMLAIFVLLTIRARAATLTTILMLFFVLFESNKNKDFFSHAVLVLVFIIIIYVVLPQSIKDYIYDSFFINYSRGGITNGRIERNHLALKVVFDHLLFGNMVAKESIGWVHNYPLLKLYSYGLVFSLPILILYLNLFINSILYSIRCDNMDFYNIGFYILSIPCIISLAEPTLPFGPGTATVFNFILFGISLKNLNNEMINL